MVTNAAQRPGIPRQMTPLVSKAFLQSTKQKSGMRWNIFYLVQKYNKNSSTRPCMIGTAAAILNLGHKTSFQTDSVDEAASAEPEGYQDWYNVSTEI